eukprot:scaffold5.g642.t1
MPEELRQRVRGGAKGQVAAAALATARADVVVAGAGPAGILAAVACARAGLRVRVYERGPSPLAADASRPEQAYVIALKARGEAAISALGLSVRELAAPGGGLQEVEAIAVGAGAALEQRRLRKPAPQLLGTRHAYVAALLAQAQRLHPSIEWHWGVAVEGVDLHARTLSLRPVGGSSDKGAEPRPAQPQEQVQEQMQQQRYDLLVAADGVASRLRRAADAQTTALSCTVEREGREYKLFGPLPPSPAVPLACASGRALLRMLRPGARRGAGPPPRGLLVLWRDANDGSARGALALDAAPGAASPWAGLATAAACRAFLAAHFSALPAEWLSQIAEQLADGPPVAAGARVHAAQLHAQALLLLGDAGHALLEAGGGDLATLPERYTAVRLPDVAALLALDGGAGARMGQCLRWGQLHPAALSALAASLARRKLSMATRGWVRPPALVLSDYSATPFREVEAMVRRDDAVAAGLAAAAAAALAWRWLA